MSNLSGRIPGSNSSWFDVSSWATLSDVPDSVKIENPEQCTKSKEMTINRYFMVSYRVILKKCNDFRHEPQIIITK